MKSGEEIRAIIDASRTASGSPFGSSVSILVDTLPPARLPTPRATQPSRAEGREASAWSGVSRLPPLCGAAMAATQPSGDMSRASAVSYWPAQVSSTIAASHKEREQSGQRRASEQRPPIPDVQPEETAVDRNAHTHGTLFFLPGYCLQDRYSRREVIWLLRGGNS